MAVNFVFFGQENISLLLKSKTPHNDSIQISNSYEDYRFYLVNNSIVKKNQETSYTYNNINLGGLYKFDLFNPLQVKLFYKDQNSIIIFFSLPLKPKIYLVKNTRQNLLKVRLLHLLKLYKSSHLLPTLIL